MPLLIESQKRIQTPEDQLVDFSKFKIKAQFQDYWQKIDQEQRDGSNCGVFAMANIYNYMTHGKIRDFYQRDCEKVRLEILSLLLKHGDIKYLTDAQMRRRH